MVAIWRSPSRSFQGASHFGFKDGTMLEIAARILLAVLVLILLPYFIVSIS
jgi:hypothetical protein